MAKENCPICGKKFGFLGKRKVYDGIVCYDCAEKSGYEKALTFFGPSFTVDVIRKAVTGECKYNPLSFKKYYHEGHQIYFNYATGYWMTWGDDVLDFFDTKHNVHRIKNIIKYDYVENDKKYSVAKTAGTALVGGLVFGGAGAVVGAVIGNKQKQKIERAFFLITEEVYGVYNTIQVDLINKHNKPVAVGSNGYNNLLKTVKELGCELDRILATEEVSDLAIELEKAYKMPEDYGEIAASTAYVDMDINLVDGKSMAQRMFDYSGFFPKNNKEKVDGNFNGLCARVNNWYTSEMCLQELSDYATDHPQWAMRTIQPDFLNQMETRVLEQFAQDEASLFYKDEGVFSHGKEGLLITNKAVYKIGKRKLFKTLLEDINTVCIGVYDTELNAGNAIKVNGINCIAEEQDLILALVCLLVKECHDEDFKIAVMAR